MSGPFSDNFLCLDYPTISLFHCQFARHSLGSIVEVNHDLNMDDSPSVGQVRNTCCQTSVSPHRLAGLYRGRLFHFRSD